jgi:hypothetical protein
MEAKMGYRNMSITDQAVMQYAPAEQIEKVRRTARSLVALLKEKFNGNQTGGVSGLTFETADDTDIVGSVATPVGEARFRLVYASDSMMISAEMRLERRIRAPDDSFLWQPVYGLRVTGEGKWEFLDGRKPELLKYNDMLFEIGCATLFTVINGPVDE